MPLASATLLRAAALLRPSPRLPLLASTHAQRVGAPHLTRLQLDTRTLHAPTAASSLLRARAPPERRKERSEASPASTACDKQPRTLTTAPQSQTPSVPPHALYSNARRANSVALTVLAVAQAGFWAASTTMATQVAEPLISPLFTALGFGLSAAFAAMITTYLRRSVAHLHLLHGPVLRVVPHGLAGALSPPLLVNPAAIRAGPHADSPDQRYWTFGVDAPGKRTRFYIVDRKRGLLDEGGVAALARGGDHFMAWSLQRDARLMKTRWRAWKQQGNNGGDKGAPSGAEPGGKHE